MHLRNSIDTPDSLVAILVAARRTGDGALERAARRELWVRHRIRLSFFTLAACKRMRGRQKSPALLTPCQAAAKLAIDCGTLARLTREGRIACVRLGRVVRYRPQDVRRAVREARQGGCCA